MPTGKEAKKPIIPEITPEAMPVEDFGIPESTEGEAGAEAESAELSPMPTAENQTKVKKRPLTAKKQVKIPQVKDEATVKIEKIMEEDLKDFFVTLSPIAQQEFKIKGEETAYKIRDILKSSHVKVKNIFRLIIEWLRLLPGINKFFLEQEAKIKTDKIILLKDKF